MLLVRVVNGGTAAYRQAKTGQDESSPKADLVR